jgi:hypothetical protein
MSIVHHRAIPLQPFPGGATYQILVGVEILTILSGTGEAWIEGQEGGQRSKTSLWSRMGCTRRRIVLLTFMRRNFAAVL